MRETDGQTDRDCEQKRERGEREKEIESDRGRRDMREKYIERNIECLREIKD